jgi:hypothetical protein
MISIFQDKTKVPDNDALKKALTDSFEYWKIIRDYVIEKYPIVLEEWNYSKYGWSCRLKDKKRAIVYLLPRDKYFKIALVFGQKAYEEIMCSQIADIIKTELQSAKVYAEGRGIRIDISNQHLLPDIKKLIDLKLKY